MIVDGDTHEELEQMIRAGMSDLQEKQLDEGYWKIEGYDVLKTGLNWEATYCGSYLTRKRTLDEVRDEIRKATQ